MGKATPFVATTTNKTSTPTALICDLVSAWWWSRGCGCGVAGGLRGEARNEEREKSLNKIIKIKIK
jgi:hypothetical protein